MRPSTALVGASLLRRLDHVGGVALVETVHADGGGAGHRSNFRRTAYDRPGVTWRLREERAVAVDDPRRCLRAEFLAIELRAGDRDDQFDLVIAQVA